MDDSVFTQGGQWNRWEVPNDAAFPFYRLVITANNGDPNLLTLMKIEMTREPL